MMLLFPCIVVLVMTHVFINMSFFNKSGFISLFNMSISISGYPLYAALVHEKVKKCDGLQVFFLKTNILCFRLDKKKLV